MPSILCPCGHRVSTTPTNVGRKGVCPKCRSRVSFPAPDYPSTRDFEIAPRRLPLPEPDGTDPEMETLTSTTEDVRRASTPCSQEAPLEDEPWFFRAAVISAWTCLVLGVAQFPLVASCAGAGSTLFLCSACLLVGVSLACPSVLLLADVARNIRRMGSRCEGDPLPGRR